MELCKDIQIWRMEDESKYRNRRVCKCAGKGPQLSREGLETYRNQSSREDVEV